MVSTLDFESNNPSSILGMSSFYVPPLFVQKEDNRLHAEVKLIKRRRSFDGEGVDRTADLQLYLVVHLSHLVQLHQSAELGTSVADVEFVVEVLDLGVESGDRDVLQPDFALVTPAHPHDVVVVRTDQVQTTLLPAFSPLVDALQNDVGFFRFVDSDHFHVEAVASSDHPREGLLADLALKLGKVIGNHHAGDLLLDLTVDPHLQTLNVHALTGTLALARRNQEVVRSVIVAETEFAVSRDLVSGVMDAVELSQEEVFLLFLVFLDHSSDFDHTVFNSSQLNDVARTCIDPRVLRL
jgi:hypothetical protein